MERKGGYWLFLLLGMACLLFYYEYWRSHQGPEITQKIKTKIIQLKKGGCDFNRIQKYLKDRGVSFHQLDSIDRRWGLKLRLNELIWEGLLMEMYEQDILWSSFAVHYAGDQKVEMTLVGARVCGG